MHVYYVTPQNLESLTIQNKIELYPFVSLAPFVVTHKLHHNKQQQRQQTPSSHIVFMINCNMV